jgi:hypothetical protein
MTQIVFLVESVDRYGFPYTLTDRLKSLSPEWIEHFNSEVLKTYTGAIGIKFQTYSQIENFDPNKKYFYFISLDHFNFDFSVYFQMLGKSKLKRLHDNNIPLLFAHDLETIPHLDFKAFVNHLEWLFLMRGVYSDIQNEIIFTTAAGLIPHQKKFVSDYFYNRFKFIQSPMVMKYSADELLKAYPSREEILQLHARQKTKLYTVLNRGCRYHRLSLLHGLRALGLLNMGNVSVLESYHYNPHSVRSNTEYAKLVINDMKNGPIPKMTLDEVNISDNRPGTLPPYPIQMWNSYYDIVAETGVLYFLPDPLDLTLITEKTVKSILFMRPFIINGGPYSLQALKRFGFKTYDGIFNESYDTAENVIDRQEIIVDNVAQYLHKYNELQKIITAHEETLEFNRQHVISADYEQLLVNELMSAQ